MKTTTFKLIANAVTSMREIRDELSNEIKDMTFAEERAYLDKLLKKDKGDIPVNEKNVRIVQ